MPISASNIVQVNPRIIASGAKNLEFNGLILTKNQNVQTGAILQFADTDGVNAYFGAESTEAKLAKNYFLGYNNSFIKPRKLFFAKFIDTACKGYIRGGEVTATMEDLKGISAGSLNVTLGGEQAQLKKLNFSSATTYSDVAEVIQSALQSAGDSAVVTEATVEYSALYKAFIITTGEAGATATVAFADGDVANTLNLTEQAGAVLSQGADAETPNQCMEVITKTTQNFVNFTPAFTATETEVLGFAEWANGKGVDYLFIYADTDNKLLQPNNTQTISAKIKAKNLSAVAGVYGSAEYAAFLMGIGASIDWNRNNAIVTTAFKAQSGLPASVTNSTDAGNLIVQGMNFIGDYATRNDNFIFHYPGQMFGQYGWIDAYWSAVWIKNQIQAACMQGFESAGRVPYNDRGYTLVRAWIQDPVNRALNNGVIDAGVTLSEAQKTQVNQEVGKDIALDIQSVGYFLEVKAPDPSARVQRESPVINFYYTYGGSINRLDIPATMLN